MAFRADESADYLNQNAISYLVSRNIDDSRRKESLEAIWDLIGEIGPAVDSYPIWHPLVSHHDDISSPATLPNDRCNYSGLDHTVFFAHGFITCPYHDGHEVINAIDALPFCEDAFIEAELLNVQFYNNMANPVLVRCNWIEPLETGNLVKKKIAVPLMLEKELACWRRAKLAERWETMRPYFLGKPHGARSSLFVGQDTALSMKKVYSAIVDSGMFGPLRMD